ncbi:uncharacterized protein LOC134252574 [Saccostrea cucullata]|uniref:uncharacterized protein LOC134252574 n=1 Tax=Saccostrea cuccullata TaxID=36930 RepID=UPI002ED177C7
MNGKYDYENGSMKKNDNKNDRGTEENGRKSVWHEAVEVDMDGADDTLGVDDEACTVDDGKDTDAGDADTIGSGGDNEEADCTGGSDGGGITAGRVPGSRREATNFKLPGST